MIDAEVKVFAGAGAGAARDPDDLASTHPLAALDIDLPEVAVERVEAVPVVDPDPLAEAAGCAARRAPVGVGDEAVGCGHDLLVVEAEVPTVVAVIEEPVLFARGHRVADRRLRVAAVARVGHGSVEPADDAVDLVGRTAVVEVGGHEVAVAQVGKAQETAAAGAILAADARGRHLFGIEVDDPLLGLGIRQRQRRRGGRDGGDDGQDGGYDRHQRTPGHAAGD